MREKLHERFSVSTVFQHKIERKKKKIEQQDMFCFSQTSAFYKSSWKMLMNNKFEAQFLTGNPTGNSRCHVLASRASNMSWLNRKQVRG